MGVTAPVSRIPDSAPCPVCGTDAGYSGAKVLAAHRFVSVLPVLDDLAAARWVQTYDAAWLGRDWDGLAGLLAPNVEFVVPGLGYAQIGRADILESLREALGCMVIHEYNTSEPTGCDRGSLGIITYRWFLDSSVGSRRSQSAGRDVLVLKAMEDRWQLVWRGQYRL